MQLNIRMKKLIKNGRRYNMHVIKYLNQKVAYIVVEDIIDTSLNTLFKMLLYRN
jgi:hypothetical protein